MNKLYTFVALAAMSVSSAFAAVDGSLVRVGSAVGHSSASAVTKTLPAQKNQLKTVDQNASLTPQKTVAKKAIAKTTTDWEELGEISFTDVFLFMAYNGNIYDPYTVTIYKSKTEENTYMIPDVFPASYLDEIKFSNGTPVYSAIDGKASSLTLTFESPSQVLADFDVNLTDNSDNSVVSISQRYYGSFSNDRFNFPNAAFSIAYDGTVYANSAEFEIALPGAPDYSVSLVNTGNICNSNNTLYFSAEGGADVANLKFYSSIGVQFGDEELYETALQEGQDIVDGSYNLKLATPGWYTACVISVTPEGTLGEAALTYFYCQFNFKEEDWVNLGQVHFTDDTVLPLFGITDDISYDITLFESKTQPGQLCMANPYDNSPYAGAWGYHDGDHNHMIYVDAEDPTRVFISLQPMGVKVNNVALHDFSLQTNNVGAINNGVLTFPNRGLVVRQADMAGYYANKNDKFSLEVPDLLTVTVVCDGVPVENATVGYDDWSQIVYTNAEGVAYMPVPADNTKGFMAYKDGYELQKLEVNADGRHLVAAANLEPAAASVSLTVVGLDQEPVEGAAVTFMDKEYTTAENGTLKITDLNGAELFGTTQPITVYKDGYELYEGTIEFTETLDALVLVQLTAYEASLTLKVVTGEDLDPVMGAQVTFQDKVYQTGENGEVKINGISGPEVMGTEVAFTVYKDGYEPYEGVADFTETLEANQMVTLIAANATLTVQVFNSLDEPLVGATVTFLGKEYTTGEFGKVVINDIPAPEVIGTVQEVVITMNGYGYDVEQADFTEGFEAYAFATLEASSTSLTVLVTNEAGEALANAVVSFLGRDYTTNENGKAVLTGLPDAQVVGKVMEVYAYKDGYEVSKAEANFTETNDADVTLVLKAAEATFTLKVVTGEDWDPVEGATVTLNEESKLTAENGEVKFTGLYGPDVIGTEVVFTVYKDGYEPYNGVADFTETLEANQMVELKGAEATFTLKVVTGEDWDPVEGATVTLNEESKLTAENGEVKFTGLYGPDVIGTEVAFTVYKDGYEPYNGVADFTETLEANQMVELQAAEATLTVNVRDTEYEPIANAYVFFMDKEYFTDENGHLVIEGLYGPDMIGTTPEIYIYKDGYEPYEGVADFTETLEANVVALLNEASAILNVIVQDNEDNFVANAKVTVLDKEYTTDENGKLIVKDIPALEVLGKSVEVTVTAEGFKPYTGYADFTEGLEAYVVATLVKIDDSIGSILIDGDSSDIKVYDLNGRRVVNPANGHIYIVNGVKVRINR